jgi:hypothetical protein
MWAKGERNWLSNEVCSGADSEPNIINPPQRDIHTSGDPPEDTSPLQVAQAGTVEPTKRTAADTTVSTAQALQSATQWSKGVNGFDPPATSSSALFSNKLQRPVPTMSPRLSERCAVPMRQALTSVVSRSASVSLHSGQLPARALPVTRARTTTNHTCISFDFLWMLCLNRTSCASRKLIKRTAEKNPGRQPARAWLGRGREVAEKRRGLKKVGGSMDAHSLVGLFYLSVCLFVYLLSNLG